MMGLGIFFTLLVGGGLMSRCRAYRQSHGRNQSKPCHLHRTLRVLNP